MLIGTYRALIDGDVVHVELYRSSLLRNPDWSVVVACPSCHGVERIQDVVLHLRCQLDALHQCLVGGECLCCTLCKRHVSVGVEASEIFHADAEFLHQVVADRLVELHVICILHILRFLVRLAVEVNDAVLYLQSHSRQSHAALHVVLAAVGGSADDVSELLWRCSHIVVSCLVNLLEIVVFLLGCHLAQVHILVCEQLVACGIADVAVEVGVGIVFHQGVAGRIVEHHDVVELHVAQSFDAAVFPVWPFNVRLCVYHRQRVLRERHGERSLRDAGSVAHFAHEEVVAGEE